MKIIGNITILSLLIVLFLSSCTIEKRVHLKGYHIEWKGLNKSNRPKLVKKEKAEDQLEVVGITEDVGTKIKDALAEKGESNHDSINSIIAKLMSYKEEENRLLASTKIGPKSSTTPINPISLIQSRKMSSPNVGSSEGGQMEYSNQRQGLGAGRIILIILAVLILFPLILLVIAGIILLVVLAAGGGASAAH